MFIVQRREPSSLCANTLPFAHYPPPTPRRLRTCEYNTSGLDKIISSQRKKSSRQQAPIAKGRAAGAAERPVGIEPIQGKINDGSVALCAVKKAGCALLPWSVSPLFCLFSVSLETPGVFSVFFVFCLACFVFCLAGLSRWFSLLSLALLSRSRPPAYKNRPGRPRRADRATSHCPDSSGDLAARRGCGRRRARGRAPSTRRCSQSADA